MTSRRPASALPWQVFVSELVGTALLVLVGLSVVILMFGDGSPMTALVPAEGGRRLITGFLFGTTGALIALSPVGKQSGAHINPVVTLAFQLMGKIDLRNTFGYVVAQLVGAVLGSLPLLAWGARGRSVAFGATLPGDGYAIGTVLLGKVATTFAMVTLLCVFLGFHRIRPLTPAMFPFLYAIMVYAESPISGTSTNPARTLGPALVSGQWEGWWIYWVGPLLGSIAACLACSALAKRITVAKPTVNRIATNVGGSYVPGFNAVVAGTVLEAGELGWDVVGGPFRGTDSRPGHAAAVVQAVEQAELGPVRLRALTAT